MLPHLQTQEIRELFPFFAHLPINVSSHSPTHKSIQIIYLYGAHYSAWLPVGHFISLLVGWCAKPGFCIIKGYH